MATKARDKYFCPKCSTAKEPFLAAIWIDDDGNRLKKPIHIEVIVVLPNKKAKKDDGSKVFKGRKLECGHYVSIDVPSFLDYPSDNLSPEETTDIRQKLDKSIIKKSPAEVEATIMRHAEEYQTLLKISAKLQRQAKYALQLVDDMREKYQGQLGPEEKQTFEQKFTSLFGRKPEKTVVTSVQTKAQKDALDERLAINAVKALLAKRGHSGKEMFRKAQEAKKLEEKG